MVAASFQDMTKNPAVFVVGAEGDALWKAYLAAFPDGTNPIFKKKTEHDCSCCKHFIRRAGGVVAIDENGSFARSGTALPRRRPHFRNVAERTARRCTCRGVQDLYRVGRERDQLRRCPHALHGQGDAGASPGTTSTRARSRAPARRVARTRFAATTAPRCRSSRAGSSS